MLLIGTELGDDQRAWWGAPLPLHESLDHGKKLGLHVVVVPVEKVMAVLGLSRELRLPMVSHPPHPIAVPRWDSSLFLRPR